MVSFNKTSWFLRASNSTNPKSTKEYGSLSQRLDNSRESMSPPSPMPAVANGFIHSVLLTSDTTITPLQPRASPVAIMHLAYILPRQSSSIPIAFHQASAQGTFPWGDLYWSPYLTLEPCLIHQPHRMNSDRECFSLQTGSQPPHLKLRKKAINRVCFLFVSVASFFTYWCFYCCSAQLLESGERYSKGDINLVLVKCYRCSFENVPWDSPWEFPKLVERQLSFWNKVSPKF